MEPDVRDDFTIESDVDVHMITAQRILSFRRAVGILEHTVVARFTIVVEDDFLVQLLKVAHC